MNTKTTALNKTGDRNLSLIRLVRGLNWMNGKQFVTVICKVPVSCHQAKNGSGPVPSGAGPRLAHEKGAPRSARGPSWRKRPQSASGVLVSHGLTPQYNRRSGA